MAPATTARLWSPEAPYDGSNSTPSPASVSLKSSKMPSFAASRMEKPDSATVSLSPPPPPLSLSSPQALKASTPVATSATAALKFFFMRISFRLLSHPNKALSN